MKYLALAFVALGALAVLAFYPKTLATDPVSPSGLRHAAELLQLYPNETGPFATKIVSNTLTEGDLARLELAVEPAVRAKEAKEAEAEEQRMQSSSMLLYWLWYGHGLYWIFGPIFLVIAFLKFFGFWRSSQA